MAKFYSHDVLNYVALMTAEVLHRTNYTTADLLQIPADRVVDELVLPWALELSRIEEAVRAAHPDLYDYAEGVFGYEVVEPIAVALLDHCLTTDTLPTSQQVTETVLKYFLATSFWQLPEEIIATARKVAALSRKN